jgi:isopenicillin-N N-acyltransferase-like protein
MAHVVLYGAFMLFPQITLSGAPYERGRHYGTQAAPQIRRSIASYALLFAYERGFDWQAAQTEARAYLPVLETQVPDLLAEMQGIADGAGRRLLEIVALNARTELLGGVSSGQHPAFAEATGRNKARGVPELTECTTMAALPGATASNTTLLAQTWDWLRSQRKACVVLRVKEPGCPDLLTLTEAGIIAKIGLNSAGLGVCLNILRSTSDGLRPALPIHVLLRRLLQMTTYQEAQSLVQQTPAAASSCISIAAAGQAVSLEITPDSTAALEPHNSLLVHTNHCLLRSTSTYECAHDPASSTQPRYERATTLMQQQHGHITCETMMDVLRDQQGAPLCICRTADTALPMVEQRETVAAVVLDLHERVMHLAPDRPCDVDFVPLALERAPQRCSA